MLTWTESRQHQRPNPLLFIPFAKDEPRYALSAQVPSHGVDGLTAAQLNSRYTRTSTNWSQVGGPAGTVQRLIPQPGSDTRAIFLAQIGVSARPMRDTAQDIVRSNFGTLPGHTRSSCGLAEHI